MRELHEKASIEIEEEDKRKKRKLAITEASQSQEQLQDGQGSVGSIQMGAIGGDMSSHHQAALEGSMSADNMARQQSVNFEVGGDNGIPGTSTPYGVGQAPTR